LGKVEKTKWWSGWGNDQISPLMPVISKDVMRNMMKTSMLTLAFLLATTVAGHANESVFSTFLSGAYELMESSSSSCDDGDIVQIIYDDEGQVKSALVIGTVLHIDVTKLGQTNRENVPDGCAYESTTTFENLVLSTTLKSDRCPNAEENQKVTHRLSKTKDGYSLETDINGSITKCFYKRGKE
jgi:hypothetical protein